jgi:hypothetical protein
LESGVDDELATGLADDGGLDVVGVGEMLSIVDHCFGAADAGGGRGGGGGGRSGLVLDSFDEVGFDVDDDDVDDDDDDDSKVDESLASLPSRPQSIGTGLDDDDEDEESDTLDPRLPSVDAVTSDWPDGGACGMAIPMHQGSGSTTLAP